MNIRLQDDGLAEAKASKEFKIIEKAAFTMIKNLSHFLEWMKDLEMSWRDIQDYLSIVHAFWIKDKSAQILFKLLKSQDYIK